MSYSEPHDRYELSAEEFSLGKLADDTLYPEFTLGLRPVDRYELAPEAGYTLGRLAADVLYPEGRIMVIDDLPAWRDHHSDDSEVRS